MSNLSHLYCKSFAISCLIIAILPSSGFWLCAQQISSRGIRATQTGVTWGKDLVSSSNSGPSINQGININQFLGADRFYSQGYTGSTSVLANIEAGHARSTHEVLSHISQQVTGTGALGSESAHASAATHAMSGRFPGQNYPVDYYGYGIGHGAETWTGAVATTINVDGTFDITDASLASTYSQILQTGVSGKTADVFNSSWTTEDATGFNTYTFGVDALINNNRKIGVVGAGNSGPASNSVGGLGAGYNSITVGALGTDTDTSPYDTISSFSSRGPNDFYNAATEQVVENVRSVIDIVAPGENLTLAYPFLPIDNLYLPDLAGTSFSSPLVAGGAGLMVDAGNQLYGTADAIDGRVIKSILMNSADKTNGWNNGQANVDGVLQTTQSLDLSLGAGRMNLDRAFDQYVLSADGGMAGTADVFGLGQGDLGNVAEVGWDYGDVLAIDGSENYYFIQSELIGGTEFAATLTWFADRETGNLSDFMGAGENHLANLDLTIFEFDNLNDRNIISTIALSNSLYNMSEHLSFILPKSGYYGIKVRYTGAHWDFGAAEVSEQYGLTWSGTAAVPEPTFYFLLVALVSFVYLRRRKWQVSIV